MLEAFDPLHNPDNDFSAKIAENRGKLFLVPTGDEVEDPNPATAPKLNDEHIIAAEQHIPEIRDTLDPTGEQRAQEQRRQEILAAEEAFKKGPPPSLR
jgi:hypothetical protein